MRVCYWKEKLKLPRASRGTGLRLGGRLDRPGGIGSDGWLSMRAHERERERSDVSLRSPSTDGIAHLTQGEHAFEASQDRVWDRKRLRLVYQDFTLLLPRRRENTR